MILNRVKRILHRLHHRKPASLYLSRDQTAWPHWMVRDLGVDDPENLKAIENGSCRKPDLSARMAEIKQPEHP
ncbi:hypothetical protein LP7551_02688 [Roseibium album]|nr:hypothetical protein LP7551_02688 [Roseibium album]